MKKKILLIGGSGIVGSAIAELFFDNNWEVYCITLNSNPELKKNIIQIEVDRNTNNYESTINNELPDSFNIIADLYSYSKKDAEQTYELFKDRTKQFIVLSTVLVYDRSQKNTSPIKSSHPLSKNGQLGGYVDGKLEVEHFWKNIKDVPWTILRPYHILGKGCYLGCLPLHNRDIHLLDLIKKEKELFLYNNGNLELNIIDTRDLADIFLDVSLNKKTYFKTYNVANPQKITALQYYEVIASFLNKKLNIKSVDSNYIWNEHQKWQMTILPHLYNIDDLKLDTNFKPNFTLKESIKWVLDNYPQNTSKQLPIVHDKMNKLPLPLKPDWV